MFECKVCQEKDRRISDMREQVEYLRNILNPPGHRPEPVEPVNLQQDMILDGGGNEEVSPEDEPTESPEVLAERAAMLSGSY